MPRPASGATIPIGGISQGTAAISRGCERTIQRRCASGRRRESSTIAISVLGSVQLAVPAAVYSVLMFPAAAVFGWLITRRDARDREAQATG